MCLKVARMRKSAVACAVDLALVTQRMIEVRHFSDKLLMLPPGAIVSWARQHGKTRLRDAWLKSRGMS